MRQARIDLHIGELILRDLPYAQRHHIAAAAEQELARLLSEQGLPPSLAQGGHIPHIDIGSIQLTADSRADTIGEQIAQSVYGKLAANQSLD
jgi:hypothetical protein